MHARLCAPSVYAAMFCLFLGGIPVPYSRLREDRWTEFDALYRDEDIQMVQRIVKTDEDINIYKIEEEEESEMI